MTNRVDFYQGDCAELAIPSGRCEVFVGGVPCPFLEVTEIVRQGFGYAKLRYNPAAYDQAQNITLEQAGRTAATGKTIEICRLVNTGIGEVKIEPVWVFAGKIEESSTKLAADEQILEVTARDFAARLDREVIDGKRISTGNGKSVFWLASEAVFNEDGLANASIQKVQHNGSSYTAFAGDGQAAKLWSTAEVLRYLLSEHVVYGQLQMPAADYLEAITGGNLADELDADGKSVLDAIQDCCEQVGIEFWFGPVQEPFGPREKMVFYRPGEGRSVELNLQYAGEQLSISRTNVCEFESEKQNGLVDPDVIETIDVRTPIMAVHFEVGDRVTVSPDSRDVLGVRRDNRSIFWIDRVKMDFEKQCTDLRILRKQRVQ
ncbi:MAG: hypothetical protein ACYTFK_01270 [Planctomycetota bacterium]|jgi:hypothetical protein